MKKIFIYSILLVLISCGDDEINNLPDIDFRQEMRNFVIGISAYGKAANANFIIIPQNGIELVTTNGEEDGGVNTAYLNAIDGHGQEDLFFGYDNDDDPTLSDDNDYLRAFLDKSRLEGNTILVTDYCSTPTKMDASYSQNHSANYISFAANHRELDNIPSYPLTIYAENNATIAKLNEVKNFLYLINPENFTTKSAFIDAIILTNYDLLIIDLFFHDGLKFSAAEIEQLKNKANGGRRLVVSYMSIGEAEDYRFYWQSGWNQEKPAWIDSENPDWAGNFKVRYWQEEWQTIIFGNTESYLQKIIDAGFDGVYLDIIDAFEYYE